MLINLSNHPSEKWSKKQLNATLEYGQILDMAFPAIDPAASTEEIEALANAYYAEIVNIFKDRDDNCAVHLMGELTFTFALVQKLQKKGIKCIASTTQRLVTDNGPSKTVEFNFCRFREYPRLTDHE